MGGKEYTPPEISAMILQKLKADAEAFLGDKLLMQSLPFRRTSMMPSVKRPGRWDHCRVECLAYYQRTHGSRLAYGMDRKKEETIAVYDPRWWHFRYFYLGTGEGTFPSNRPR